MIRRFVPTFVFLAILCSYYVSCEINFNELDDEPADNTTTCEIHNVKYADRFLFAETLASSKRPISLGKYIVFADRKQKSWEFLPVDGIKNGFYLKNKKYSEKLYASTQFLGFNPFTQKRRVIYTWRFSENMQLEKKSFIWIIQKTENNPEQYYIYNLAYREPLYAGSWGYKGSVYLWHEKHENHNQFRWTIKCSKGNLNIE